MIKLNAAEVRVLKMWSCKDKFALRDAKRRGKPAVTHPTLSIPADNFTGKIRWAFDSLAERGLLEPRTVFSYFKLSAAGAAECCERWPEEGN